MSDTHFHDRAHIRVRFAPSPTGYLHVGGARTALFNWLFARQTGGTFVLRIEDTDIQRSSEEMVRGILEGLEWLGLDYDEGPFFQSDYDEQHRAAAYQLLESGAAYRDFTPKEERPDADVKKLVAEAAARGPKQMNPYRDLPRAESDRRAAAGEPFVIRFKVPAEGQTRFEDAVYGPQERDYKDIEDLVLLRSDGHPLYNLSVVVDDIEMGITHVIRGQDHLSNTHKQVLLYQALGKRVPQFAHLPLILAPNKGKLSKRKHGEIVSVTTYRDAGFIPDAFVNFLALLGWSPASGEHAEREIFSRAELVQLFSLEGIHKANAVFNFTEGDARNWTDQKALWMNWEYIKTVPMERLFPMVKAELQQSGLWRDEYEGERRAWFEYALTLLRERARTLKDFTNHGRPYFVDDFSFEFDEAAVKKNLKKDPALKDLLPQLADAFAQVGEFTHDATEAALRKVADEKGVKAGLLINATRTALTGQAVGPGLFDVVVAIGKERTVARLRHAAEFV
jgi:glutamyl-tRNA synthetase